MTQFIQLHLLTSYPPGNPNRDDLGRPKTATLGGTQRLRISSQSLKRAWRTSSLFSESLNGHVGRRTKEMGLRIYKEFVDGGIKESDAKKWAGSIAGVFGKLKAKGKEGSLQDLEIEQLAHFSPEEEKEIDDLIKKLIQEKREPKEEELRLLREHHTAADIALFGRMLASDPKYNTDAAAQVAHAFSIHPVALEDDYFTAVDDLNTGEEDVGAGHLGVTEFAAGLMYLYVCINRDLLQRNLDNDAELTRRTLRALTECAATVAPSGKQNSFATRTRASFVLAEKGSQQPRSLSVAWLNAFHGNGDFGGSAVQTLMDTREKLDNAYGPCASASKTMNAFTGEGSLKEILDFISE